MTGKFLSRVVVCLIFALPTGCEQQRSPFEGEWVMLHAKVGEPTARIHLRTRGQGDYWDGFSRLNLNWSVENDTVTIVSDPAGEFEGWKLKLGTKHSTLDDLHGVTIFLSGEPQRKLASIAGVWEEGPNSLHIRDSGFASWKYGEQRAGELKITPGEDGLVATMKFLDRELKSELLLDQSGRLVWKASEGDKALHLVKVR